MSVSAVHVACREHENEAAVTCARCSTFTLGVSLVCACWCVVNESNAWCEQSRLRVELWRAKTILFHNSNLIAMSALDIASAKKRRDEPAVEWLSCLGVRSVCALC